MTTVVLHGELATAMGRAEWQFEIQQPREAMAALEANTGKLYSYLARRHDESKGAVQYRVLVDGRDIGRPKPDEVPSDFYLVGVFVRIDIIPVMQGSGGLWQTIIGVVLVIVGVVLLFTPAAAVAPYVIMAGISMTLGGVAQMLAPSPKLGAGSSPFGRTFMPPDALSGGEKEEAKNTPSYLFSGAVNTTLQGNPVPVCYGGPILVGSALISLAITGATVDSAQLGSMRPPRPNNPLYDLPVWTRLANDPRRGHVPSQKAVKQASVAAIQTVYAPALGIPSVYPANHLERAGQPIPIGNATLPRKTKRGYLSTLAYYFSGNPRPIKWTEAADLYKLLEVGDTTNLETMSWKDIVLATALFLSPNP